MIVYINMFTWLLSAIERKLQKSYDLFACLSVISVYNNSWHIVGEIFVFIMKKIETYDRQYFNEKD